MWHQQDVNSGQTDSNTRVLTGRLESTLERFWKRWRDEYLLELRNTHTQGSKEATISKGDVVIVKDENQPRGFWRLGLVTDTITGKDGRIRGATVKVCPKLNRPIHTTLEVNARESQLEN